MSKLVTTNTMNTTILLLPAMDSPVNRGSSLPVNRSLFSPGTIVCLDGEERVGRPDSEGGIAYVTNGSIAGNRICTVKYTVNAPSSLTTLNYDHSG